MLLRNLEDRRAHLSPGIIVILQLCVNLEIVHEIKLSYPLVQLTGLRNQHTKELPKSKTSYYPNLTTKNLQNLKLWKLIKKIFKETRNMNFLNNEL